MNKRMGFVFSLYRKLYLCLGMAVLADWLFYDRPLGWSAGIYAGLATALLCCFQGDLLKTRHGRSAALAAAILCLSLIESASYLSMFCCLAALTMLPLVSKRGRLEDAALHVRDFLKFLRSALLQGQRDSKKIKRVASIPARSGAGGQKRWRKPGKGVVRYMLLPLLMALSFSALFAMANPVLEELVRALDLSVVYNLFSLRRWAFWLIIGTVAWAFLRPRFALAARPDMKETTNLDFWISAGSVRTSLLVFNLIFAVQNGMDILYLWNGVSLPEGMSHAAYAHAGAYPLVATALLAAVYVLLVFDPGRPQYQTRAARGLVFCWIAQNIFLVTSSMIRLARYVEDYSLTYLRVAAFIWMGLVAAGFVLIVLRILLQRTNTWLVNMNAGFLALTLSTSCFVNFGSIVADYNVRHACEISGQGSCLDLAYLQGLGEEAIPALLWFQKNVPDSRNYEVMQSVEWMSRRLVHDMGRDWRGWTWRKQRILDAVNAENHGTYVPPPPYMQERFLNR